jgi:mannosyltransferase
VAWLVPALTMLVLGRLGVERPVLGWDELATWNVIQRPVPKIMALVSHIDGALTPYYLFMHWWTGLVGTTHLDLRVPSIVAMAVAAALVARIGTRLADPFTGLVAGLLFVAVPSVSRYAQDARPYAFAVLFATLATLLLLRAVDKPGWPRWGWYALAVALLGLSNILAFLLLLGHAVAVVWCLRETRDRRLLRWLAAAVAGVAPSIPLIRLSLHQHDTMLAWLHDYNPAVAAGTALQDIFGATAAGLLIVGAALFARPDRRWVLATLAVIAVVPAVVLLLVSVATPVWVPRYVLYTVAAWTLLAAFAVRGMRVRAVVLIALVACVAIPAQGKLRGHDAHVGPDDRKLAALLRTHARPGDGIIYAVGDLWSVRNGIEYYLGSAAPRDVLLHRSRLDNDTLVDTECPDAAACIGDTRRLWLVRCLDETKDLTGIGSAEQFIRTQTALAETYAIKDCYLRLYVRGPS